MWDTGKVDSDQSVNVVYEGAPLESGKRYYWRVQVWDKHGNASEWSEPAWWEMGLLEESDWQGDWIGLDAGEMEEGMDLEGADWIWYPEGDPAENAPVGQRYFRYAFEWSSDQELSKAEMLLTADDRYVLYVNGEHADSSPQVPDGWKQARLVDVTDMLNAGHNVIAIVATNSEGADINPAGLIGRMQIEYESGETFVFETNSDWKTSKTGQEGWQEPDFDDTDWDSAMELAPYGGALWGDQVQLPTDSDKPAPLIRNEFTLDKPVEEARVYVSGLGYYELSLNGQKVGDHVLDPNSTNYEKRVLYTTYDVTSLLSQGDNAIGVELGRGRYGMTTPNTWIWHEAPWHDDPKVLLQLVIKYEDGSTETIVSDESWRATEGPTRFDSLYEGERFDARLVQDGWTSAGFDDTGWEHAVQVEPPAGELRAQQHEPIKVMDTIQPKSVEEVKPGVYVFDFGVNVAGWAELQVEGPRGSEVTLIYGEKLHDDGTVDIDQGNIYAQIQTDHYILSGEGIETWEPKFSYKGYQYVQVSGYPGEPTLDSLEGRVIHTSVASTGEFSTSDPLLNQINENVRRAYLNNLYDVPTDTPVWEKNGWTGDAQVMATTSIYNFHMPRFYTKWVNDIRDSQKPSGELSDIVPTSGWSYEGSPGWTAVHGPTPAWDAALFEIPWEMYRQYGDERILSDVYEEMKRYLDYLESHADGHIVRLGLGDWIPPGYGGSPPEGPDLTSTAYYYRFAETISNIADILGKDAEARTYEEKAADIRAAFHAEFFDEQTNVYSTNRDVGYRQTSNAVPLAFGLAPKDREEAIIARLAEDVVERGNHLNTGIVGTKVLFPMLTAYGYEDLAYAIAAQRTYPSWGYWIDNGATALYESWELNSRSRNHHMFGSIGEWFYADLAGIQPGSPGYGTVLIKPAMPEDLKQATGRVETVKGDVASSWEQHSDGTVTLDVEIPANTTATVYVPADRKWGVMEGGQPAHTAEGVSFLKMEDGYAVFEVGSGNYQFTVHPVSAAYMNTLVEFFKEAGEFANDGAARALDVHLVAVNRFEEKGEAEKVVKHLKGLQQLLNNQRENNLISEEAYGALESEMLSLVDTYFAAHTDTLASKGDVLPGDTFHVEVTFHNSGKVAVDDVDFALQAPEGWRVTRDDAVASEEVQPGERTSANFHVTVPTDQRLDTIPLTGEAVYRKFGENKTIASQTTVNVASPIRIQQAQADPVKPGGDTTLHVTLENVAQHSFSGDVTVEAPAGWAIEPETRSYQLDAGAEERLAFTVSAPEDAEQGATFTVKTTYGDQFVGEQKAVDVILSNLALNKTVLHSSSYEQGGWGAAKVVDGQTHSSSDSMGWTSDNDTSNNHTEWLTIDLGTNHPVSEVVLYPRSDGQDAGYGFPIDFTIQVSTDNEQWTTVVEQSDYPFPEVKAQRFSFDPQEARYVKVEGTNLRANPHDGHLYRMQFAEIQVN